MKVSKVVGLGIASALLISSFASASDVATYPASGIQLEAVIEQLPPLPIAPQADQNELSTSQLAQKLEAEFGLSEARALRFAHWIRVASILTDVPAELLAGVVMQESSFRERVRSPVGAIGPAQVRPVFWRKHCPGDISEPRFNILCGALVLETYQAITSDWKKTLAWYNVGPSGWRTSQAMRQAGKRYSQSVLKHQARLLPGATAASD